MARTKSFKLECIQEIEGFDLGKSYECLGFSSGYVEIINNEGNREIMPDKYFKPIGKSKVRR